MQRFTLNVTRSAMLEAGFSPSVRLFEAAACGIPVITDEWVGLSEFFEPGREILVARNADDALAILRELPERHRLAIAGAARARFLREHSANARARALEQYTRDVLEAQSARIRSKRTEPRV
jgi:spore maturation protein CgeB